ncbi:hypothetical protein GCM10020331_018860 [Ectobacillus funiculus]
MNAHYYCRYCGYKVGSIEGEEAQEMVLGNLTNEEQLEMTHFDENGNLFVKKPFANRVRILCSIIHIIMNTTHFFAISFGLSKAFFFCLLFASMLHKKNINLLFCREGF